MKHLILIIALACFELLPGQTIVRPQLLNTCGGSGDLTGVHYDWSLGEPYTLYGGTTCDSLFTGFQHCAVDSMVQPKQAIVTSGGPVTFCAGASVLLTAQSGQTYSWNNGNTSQSILVTTTGSYYVTVYNACGDELHSDTINVTALLPPVPEICMITVDSQSVNNIIYWDKTLYPMADSFYVYRDTANNNFALIGAVSYDSLSLFADTLKTLYAANGDPNVSSWRYKIAIMDSCGNIGQKSPYHQTMFIQNSSGNFIWNHYQIENQTVPVPALSNYEFLRDDISSGNWNTIQTLSASSTAYTDPQYATFQTSASWRVETSWTVSCDPARAIINTSRSNVRAQLAPLGLNETQSHIMNVYPNPAKNFVTISDKKNVIKHLSLKNLIGEEIEIPVQNKTSQTRILDISTLGSGMYTITVIFDNGDCAIRKLIKE